MKVVNKIKNTVDLPAVEVGEELVSLSIMPGEQSLDAKQSKALQALIAQGGIVSDWCGPQGFIELEKSAPVEEEKATKPKKG